MLFCSPIHNVLLSSLHYYVFLFILLSFPLHYFALRIVLLSFLHCSLLWLLSYFRYKVFRTTILFFTLLLLVCCYSLKNLVLPPCIPSCKSWEWSKVDSRPLVFFLIRFFFPFVFFHFFCFLSHVFYSFVLIFFVFVLWCMVCYELFLKHT